MHSQVRINALIGLLFILVLAGCSSHKPTQARVPSLPPPTTGSSEPSSLPPPAATNPSKDTTLPPVEPAPHRAEIIVPPDAPVLYTETGLASWYGPHYNKRRSSNGEVYDMDGLTAAHRTLPLNCIARVTNVKTGDSVLLRITDRGPFVGDRIIDLSKAAAQKLDVYRRGTAMVRVDVVQTPSPILTGGKWSVQIGPFKEAEEATRLKEKLMRRYHTAKVLQFTSPIQEVWLRVKVADDDRRRAESVMQETQTDAGMYLMRMD